MFASKCQAKNRLIPTFEVFEQTCMSTQTKLWVWSHKNTTNASVKRVSATCWAPESSPEWCRWRARCWAIRWNHRQGQRCCWSPSPSSSSPSRPPLHPPLSTDGSGCTAGAKQRKNKAKSLEKWIYAPKSPPATLVVYWKNRSCFKWFKLVFLVHRKIMSRVTALLFI